MFFLASCCSFFLPQMQFRLQSRVARWHILKPKNPKLGKFWRALQRKVFAYFMAIWSFLFSFGIFCGNLAHFMIISYIFSRFGVLCKEKSGDPASQASFVCNDLRKGCFN
jgi:hypothetical protein